MKIYYVIAGIVVVAFIALGASSFKSTMTPYITDFSKVRASTQPTIQAPGQIVKGKTVYQKTDSTLIFSMKDEKNKEMKFVYKGQMPANFDQADRVVAIGKYNDGVFNAERLLVKCPSKYNDKAK
jgi:cytochrome c-type biogenesis protein CcmE